MNSCKMYIEGMIKVNVQCLNAYKCVRSKNFGEAYSISYIHHIPIY